MKKTKEEQALELTQKQRNIVLYMKDHHKETGYYPTLREIGENFGINFSSVRQHLMAVEKKGYIERKQKSRAIKFLKKV